MPSTASGLLESDNPSAGEREGFELNKSRLLYSARADAGRFFDDGKAL
ncbi:hypothetical protein [Saccharibacillus kuerlensis]|nr:hypothetical protein [Saccharibacillus kuerlensis]